MFIPLIWILIGFIASILMIIVDVCDGQDFTRKDLIKIFFLSFLGPVWAIILTAVVLSDKNKFLDKVVIKGKKKNNE